MAKTVEQISSALNLSITTVRLVLNGQAERYRISQKTQKKIQDYVNKYGYTINHIARSLKLNKTETLGLIVPNLSNPFFSSLAESMELSCRSKGYRLMICCTHNDPEHEKKLLASLEERNVDGIFVVPVTEETQMYHIKTSNKPIVFLDRDFAQNDSSWVVSDNFESGYALTSSMFKLIQKPIVFFAGAPILPPVKERIAGFISAMVENGIDKKDCEVFYSQTDLVNDGELLMKEYIETHNDIPQNFIASSLPILEGISSLLRQHLGYIPDNLNIGAFDEHIMLNFLANNIWSMKQNDKDIAENAIAIMNNKISGEKSSDQIKIKTEIISRLKKK